MGRGEPVIRQWNLLKALQAHRFGISVEELADRLECSKRQVQRDLRVLLDSGFPVRYDEREFCKRFWKLESNFVESKGIILSFTEMISLYLGQKLLVPLLGTQLGSGILTLLEKIKAVLPSEMLEYFGSLEETLLVKNAVYQDYSKCHDEIFLLNKAISESRVVSLRYLSRRRQQGYSTEFHPYGLVFYGTNLYVIGYLQEYSEIRTLKINRVSETVLTDKTFERPRGFSLKEYTEGGFGVFSPGKPQDIKVRFTGWAAHNVREQSWHVTQKVVKDAKDHIVVKYTLSNTAEFKRWVLGFGAEAVVLSPESLAHEIHNDAKAIASLYNKGFKDPTKG